MKPGLIRQSLWCGVLLLGFSTGFTFLDRAWHGGMSLLIGYFAAGLAYTLVLLQHTPSRQRYLRGLFVVSSTGLYGFSATLFTGYGPFEMPKEWDYAVGSTTGAIGLFVLYFACLNRRVSFLAGCFLAAVVGLLGSVLPYVGDPIIEGDTYVPENYLLWLLCTYSIYPVWQTLFSTALWLLNRHRSPSGA